MKKFDVHVVKTKGVRMPYILKFRASNDSVASAQLLLRERG